jgi:hypothetical protein
MHVKIMTEEYGYEGLRFLDREQTCRSLGLDALSRRHRMTRGRATSIR